MTAVVPTLERIKLMDFTYPISKGDFRLMLPYPDKEKSSIVAIFQIFTPQVWSKQINKYLKQNKKLEKQITLKVGAATFMLLLIGISFICVYQYGYLPSDSKSIISIFDFVGRRVLYFLIIFSGRSGCGSFMFLFIYILG